LLNRLITILFIFIVYNSIGNPILQKGFPYIKNFEINEYSSQLQSWMSAQAPNGFIYIANSSKLLEFDGINWNTFTLPNNSALRSLAIDETGRIFVGGTREFGYFFPDEYGRLIYYSLSAEIDRVDFESVWRVLKTSKGIYFVTGRKHIYRFTEKGLSLVIAPAKLNNFRASVVNDTIFFYDINAGFGAVLNDTMLVMKNTKLPASYTPYFFIEGADNEVVVGVRQHGVFKFHNNNDYYSWNELLKINFKEIIPQSESKLRKVIKPLNKELNRKLGEAELYFGLNAEGMYFFSTLRKGLFIADKNFNLINNYRKGSGLENDAVYHVNVDKLGGVWISGEMGISYIRYQNPFIFFNQRNNINGIVISVKAIDDILIFGTTQGLFMMDKNLKNLESFHQSELITDKYAYVLDVEPLTCCKDEVLVASLRDILIYNYKSKRLTPIYKLYGTYDIANFPGKEDVYVFGNTQGIEVLEIVKLGNGTFKVKKWNGFKEFTENIRHLVFDNQNQLWMSTAYNGVFMAKFDDKGNVENIKKYGADYGLDYDDNNLPVVYQDTLLMATRSGVLYYDDNDKLFRPYGDLYGLSVFDSVVISDLKIVDDKIWFALDKGVMNYDLKTGKIERKAFNRLKQYGSESLEIDNNGVIWLSSLNNLIAIDTTYLKNQYYKTPIYFRNILFGTDSLYKTDLGNNYISSIIKAEGIPFEYNSLSVTVACPAYQTLENIQFSYRLIGLNDRWSDWSKNNTIKFSYLPGGDYTLEVQARDANLEILGKAIMQISIEKPFYYTFWAILIYVIIGILLIYFLVRLNSKRLQSDKNRLQDAINEAIYTVQQQKEEIQQQAQFLADTNKQLEKMSIVAEYTDNAVAIMDGKGNYQWINKGFTRMYGYEYEELIRDDDRGKIGRNANLRMNDLINVWFGDKKPIIYESLNKCKNGEELWVQTTLTPILDSKGNVIKLITIDTDISKLKQAEKQIESQRDEISKQRDLAYVQRDEILQQKKEITDSIHYAQRIQNALFPSKGVLDSIFEYNFIFNLPRDIVSGDFFWTYKNDNLSMLAVSDCTGHGVPGAFMSLIGLNFLNDIVKNQRIYNPDLILNKLRDSIISGLKQTNEVGDNKDGMDIAIISFDSETRILKYAGANNMSIIKRGDELITLEPDKMPISIFRDIKEPFTIKEVEIEKGDILYMFTDGYIDQFGGKKGKKFKTINFRKLLQQIKTDDLKVHEIQIEDNFYNWKGDLDQVDDVLVIGLKLI
jgi:PAS domain S-box-containing protein